MLLCGSLLLYCSQFPRCGCQAFLLSMKLMVLVVVFGSPNNIVLMFCVRLIVACVIVDSLYAIIVDMAVVWGYRGVLSWVVVGLVGGF